MPRVRFFLVFLNLYLEYIFNLVSNTRPHKHVFCFKHWSCLNKGFYLLTYLHNLWRAFVDFLFDNHEKVDSSYKYTHIKARVEKLYPTYDQNKLNQLYV